MIMNDDDKMAEYIINTLKSSLFWDEEWYRKKYNISDDKNALHHYITDGYKSGYDPGPHFKSDEYYENNPDVKQAGINPLIHFEICGINEDRNYKVDKADVLEKMRKTHPDLQMKLDGGFLRVRVTNDCNAKCRYCGVRRGYAGDCYQHMNPDWYLRLLRPIYEKVDQVLLTGGDPFICKESYELMEMLGREYPHLTVTTETNGFMLNEKFRKLLADCLFTVHVSLNASNKHTFQDSCWEGNGGERFFDKVQDNLKEYIALLGSRDMLCFAPDYSMVINKDNYQDIIHFIKLALSLKGRYITFFFDYTENNMAAPYFTNPNIMRPVLKKLMEIERVLARNVLVMFRLWIPYKEAEMLQVEVDKESDSELREKYSDLLELAKDRFVEKEFEKRNELRKQKGKRELTFDQDFASTLRQEHICNKKLCFAPWSLLDLYPSGRLDFCSWYNPTLNINNYIDENNNIDWNEVYNSYVFMRERNKILNGNYDNCQSCCPLNDVTNPIIKPYEFGYGRLLDRKY